MAIERRFSNPNNLNSTETGGVVEITEPEFLSPTKSIFDQWPFVSPDGGIENVFSKGIIKPANMDQVSQVSWGNIPVNENLTTQIDANAYKLLILGLFGIEKHKLNPIINVAKKGNGSQTFKRMLCVVADDFLEIPQGSIHTKLATECFNLNNYLQQFPYLSDYVTHRIKDTRSYDPFGRMIISIRASENIRGPLSYLAHVVNQNKGNDPFAGLTEMTAHLGLAQAPEISDDPKAGKERKQNPTRYFFKVANSLE